ncbi:MAG: FecR domain-containing protein [Rhodoplanes sp.]|uniref:FecR family protein n=1 Tax=Rhodoplanes sp. TaxID=1968906 RepID=UPI0018155535|nr:FecR domain-containing protein [Rhodoplanes sp.]NVO13583.1 FecR domain-containing protein [Rhodoplanes sp.]
MVSAPHHESADGDAELDRVKREALTWMRRLGSGEMTRADLDALDRWRMASEGHRRAFAEANLFWDVLGQVAREAKARGHAGEPSRLAFGTRIGRRAFLAGAAAATIAYVVVQPPLGLWPSLAELGADYRTATGEQRQLAIRPGLTVDMNTQTSLVAPATGGTRHALELVSGQIAVSVQAPDAQPLRVAAAQVQIEADRADFDVRRDGSFVCVTCTEGVVRVTRSSSVTVLTAGQQQTYDGDAQARVVAIDPTVVTAWKRGMIIFRDVPLAQVIAEINRYRPGRIVLLNKALADRTVVAGFRLDQIGEAVDYLSRAIGARARSLPGGVVLLT